MSHPYVGIQRPYFDLFKTKTITLKKKENKKKMANVSGKTLCPSEQNFINLSVFSLSVIRKDGGLTLTHIQASYNSTPIGAISNLHSPRQSFFIILQG